LGHKPAEVVATTFAASDVIEESAKLTVPVAQESATPTILNTAANAMTLAELNTMGLDVSLPKVSPNYSAAANADLILGGLWTVEDDTEIDYFAVPTVQQTKSAELLDQLIADIF